MDSSESRLPRVLLIVLIAGVIVWGILLDFLPPVEKDTLIHHLAVPKIWLRAGGFVDMPWADFSYNPMNVELLYLIPLAWGFDCGAKLIHNAFGLLTALLIFFFLKKRLSVNWALTGVLIFLSTPLIMRLAASAYVDLGLAFFITITLMALIEWHESGRIGYFFISAAALGLGLGTKYNGLLALPLLGLGVAWLRGRQGQGFIKAVLWGGFYLGAAGLVFAPWAIKNYVLTGNPLFPLYNSAWGVTGYLPEPELPSLLDIRRHLYGESLLATLLVPVRFFFQGQDFSARYFDGVLNPFLLLLPIPAVIRPARWEIRPLAVFSGLWVLLVFLSAAFTLVRYVVPILPVLAILSVFGLREIALFLERRRPDRIGHWAVVLLMAALVGYNGWWAANFWAHLTPGNFLLGRETREEYLMRTQVYYPAIEFMNRNLDPKARVLFLMAGSRGYYLDRDYFFGSIFSGEVLRPILDQASSGKDILEGLKKLGATHVLTREVKLVEFLRDNWPREKAPVWNDFSRNYWRLLFKARGFSVYELK